MDAVSLKGGPLASDRIGSDKQDFSILVANNSIISENTRQNTHFNSK
jgi:hypothetical protein